MKNSRVLPWFLLSVLGSAGVASAQTFYTNVFTVDTRETPGCPALSTPSLSAPGNGASVASTSVPFSWQTVQGAELYDLYLDTSPSPNRIVLPNLVPPAGGETTVSCSVVNLQAGVKYYWKVVAKGNPTCSPQPVSQSEVRSFSTPGGCEVPSGLALESPADKATGQGSTVTLSWKPAAGARNYEVYFGPTNPPSRVYSLTPSTSSRVSDLVSGGKYFWQVVAVSSCDDTKTAASPVREFTVEGSCKNPGRFDLVSPSSGAQGLDTSVELQWSVSQNANYYDVFLGTTASPPLYISGETYTQIQIAGLEPGTSYYWRIVARTSCNSNAIYESPVYTFLVGAVCREPETPQFTFSPPAAVGRGQTYVLGWTPVQTGSGGGYVVERSRFVNFNPVLDTQVVTANFASFVASEIGDYYHRVKAVAGCDPGRQSGYSALQKVTVSAAKPSVIFTVEPRAVVTRLGERPENYPNQFTLENISDSDIVMNLPAVILLSGSVPFFQFRDPLNEGIYVTLKPRVPRTFEIVYSSQGLDVTAARSLEAIVYFVDKERKLEILPYSYVNLKIGGEERGATPEFRLPGDDMTPVEYVAFPGLTGDDQLREPIVVHIYNPGTSPMEVGAEIGPEVWLKAEPGWNARPIPPGGMLAVKLFTNRSQALPGSALPRYTYLKVRTKDGKTARLLVQDNDRAAVGSGRPVLGRDETSYIVPSVVRATSAIGNTFVSRLKLSNSGNVSVRAAVYFTPYEKDGYGPEVLMAPVTVPPVDVVNITDPLVQLFGLEPGKFGSLEVRTDQKVSGLLSVTSSVDAPAKSGGNFGFQMPVVKRGQGARAGRPQEICGITASSDYRTNLILVETTGLDSTVVKVTQYSSGGKYLGERKVTVPRYGMTQINRVVKELGGGDVQVGASLEIEVESGGGSVASVITVTDNRTDDAVTFTGRSLEEAVGLPGRLAKKPSWALSAETVKVLIPSIVSGYVAALPGTGEPYMFQSLMGFKAPASKTAVFDLTFFDMAKDAKNPEVRKKRVEVERRKTVEYENVIEELFGIPPGQGAQGPVFIEVAGGGTVYTKVFSRIPGRGTLGDAFPVIPIVSEGMTGGVSRKPVEIDGLEQALVETESGQWSERTRGTRSNLILNEVLGKKVKVKISLFEPGNRGSAIAEREVEVNPLERLQLNTVFTALGLNEDGRRKDRTNVKCLVQALEGEGMVTAVVTQVDNVTADIRNGQMLPAGSETVPGLGPIGF